MNEYKIFIDLSADIDGSYVKDNNVEFVPMEYKIGEATKTSVFVESDEVMKEFYKAMGYEIVGSYENKVDGFSEYFFLKRLVD